MMRQNNAEAMFPLAGIEWEPEDNNRITSRWDRYLAGTVWDHFLGCNRMLLVPSVYKKYCDSVGRDWEIPVLFTLPDGSKVFKVLEVKYSSIQTRSKNVTPTGYIWVRNPEQNLVEGEYF
eukprot:3571524-Prymnesium_polylepis.1